MRIPNLLALLLLAFSFPLAAQNAPCEIYDLVVETGPCTSDSTYSLQVNFKVQNPPSNEFQLWGNGALLGGYKLTDLPLTINNFPGNGLLGGYVKVCMAGNANPASTCCAIKQFIAPDCSQTSPPCEIYDVKVETGDCLANGQYKVKLNFKVAGATNSLFEVWAGNGQYLGYFPLSQLPLALNFPAGGGTVDKIKICINDNPNCCKVYEFQAPACPPTPCTINDLRVETGDCTSDSTYKVVLNFKAPSVSLTDSFNVYAANGQFLGRFAYANLPVAIANFPWNGDNVDAVKICISNTCCRTKEFNAPACIAQPCGINDLKVDVGDCITPKTYRIKLNFNVALPTPGAANIKFVVRAGNGDSLGTYSLSDLPLTLDFPRSGDVFDVLKVCLLDADGDEICCKIIEFKAPVCNLNPCPISDLQVEVGPCNSDGTYSISIKFNNSSTTPGAFAVWAGNGKFLGIFPLSALPLKIAKFPASGNAVDVVKVCLIGTNSSAPVCCLTAEFDAPDCSNAPCGIFDLKVDVGPCNDDGSYAITINFGTLTAQGQFGVWAGNGQFLGVYPFSALPLKIAKFPGSGGAIDVVKVCVFTSGTASPTCCLTKEFKAPACAPKDCEIYDLKVETGPCNDNGTYKAVVNFKVQNPGPSTHFMLWANGVLQGAYPLSSLPFTIAQFPTNGGPNDYIKVCLISPASNLASNCCKTLEFPVPNCQTGPCEIYDLKAEAGPCNNDGTFKVVVNFKVQNPGASGHFTLWANGIQLGTYPLSALPLTIPNFPTNGGPNDVIKVCLVTASGDITTNCCRTLEFPVPTCQTGPCEIYDLKAEAGPCNNDGTFKVVVNFKVQNPGASGHFTLWVNGTQLGTYPLSALPLTIPNFPTNGGPNDVIKVCLVTALGDITTNCCRTLEFPVPTCQTGPCEIYDLKAEAGPCNNDGTFKVVVNFKVQNPGASANFTLWANGTQLGTYPLSALPLTIPNFPTNGGPNDVIKVCLVSATPNAPSTTCCRTVEFAVPTCQTGPCEIYDLKVETGPCNSDGTFKVVVNFKVQNPGASAHFTLWANGTQLGTYPLSALPLTIPNFPTNGGPNDVIKVCLVTASGDITTNCCRTLEFPVPNCQTGPCEIYDLKVETGPCNDNGTYKAWVNFKVQNANPVAVFGIWANGQFLGTFPLTALPYAIPNFPTDGGPNDVVKVCLLVPGSTQTLCCATKEFSVPDCLNKPCEISDVQVVTTPCLCGQFFAVVTFEHQNGGSGGFDIVGNGVNYGTFPYNQQQPIILGPLDGDNTTEYEFVVRDHLHPDCHGVEEIGKVDCTDQFSPGNTTPKVAVSPNPATDWLSVTAKSPSGMAIGQATAEVRTADGRLMRTVVVANGSSFLLDIAGLPAGIYRLSVQTAEARLESMFVKQ